MTAIDITAPEQRLDLPSVVPKAYQAMIHLGRSVAGSGLETALVELVKIRVSQINGCAYCLDMHTKDARHQGEAEQRLHVLAGWREAPFYSERERAALALAESVTLVSQTHVPDDVWASAAQVFTEQELASLLVAIVTINGWNRLLVATRTPAGTYEPAR